MGTTSFMVGLLAGVIGTAVVAGQLAERNYTPKQAYAPVVIDLNLDGVQDLIMERPNGHKTPLYGVRQGIDIQYFSASEMKRKYPTSIIDYDTIEARLNKK